MKHLIFFSLISALVTLSRQSSDYLLPKNSIPHKYKLQFIPNDYFRSFDAEAIISLEVLVPTKSLTLHAFHLAIEEQFTSLNFSNNLIKPISHVYDFERQFLTLNFAKTLSAGNYELCFQYIGFLNENAKGVFLKYLGKQDKETYFIATMFAQSNARLAFPCWDEPALKATFQISILHSSKLHALSNMPAEKITDSTENDWRVWTHFQTTPKMSTYGVAFTVSDFVSHTNSEKNVTLWHRENYNFPSSGFNLALEGIFFMTNYSNMPYPLPMVNIFVVPSYCEEFTRNWGLIVIEEDIMELRTSVGEKLNRFISLFKQIVHQWFGGLVSPASRKDAWLIEGVATYLSLLMAESSSQNYTGCLNYYLVESVDSLDFIKAAKSPILPQHRDQRFKNEANVDPKSLFTQSVLLMHMMKHFLPTGTYRNSLQQILNRYKLQSISTEEFLDTLIETAEGFGLPSSEPNIKHVIMPYIMQAEYPEISVTRNLETGNIIVTYECDACRRNNYPESQFWILINFATQSSPSFNCTMPTHWLRPNQRELIIEEVKSEDWIIFNKQNTGYYQVRYDTSTWFKILHYLSSEKFTEIPASNRMKLMIELREVPQMRNDEKLKFMELIRSYIKRETDHLVKLTIDGLQVEKTLARLLKIPNSSNVQ